MKLWTLGSRFSAGHSSFACPRLRSPTRRHPWLLPTTPSSSLASTAVHREGSNARNEVVLGALPVHSSNCSNAGPQRAHVRSDAPPSATGLVPIEPRDLHSEPLTKPVPSRVAAADARPSSFNKSGKKQVALSILDNRAPEWASILLELLDNGHTRLPRRLLSLAGDNTTIFVWSNVAYWLIDNDLGQITRFLKATHVSPYVPRKRIASCLQRVAERWPRSEQGHLPEQLQRFVDVFCLLCKRPRRDSLQLKNPTIRTILRYCTIEQTVQIYRACLAHRVRLAWPTYLHLATRLARQGHLQMGFRALLRSVRLGCRVNDYPFRSCCSTILRRASAEPEGLRVCLRIVSRLTELGVELNNPICDIIMLNAVEAGDLNTAFSVYRSLKERGLQPLESTIAILLKGCKMNIDDVNMLSETIQDAVRFVNVRNSEIVASEILHCLALHHSKHHPDTALETVTGAYARFFNLQPLQRLGLPVPKDEMSHTGSMPPGQNALNIMLGMSIEHNLIHKPLNQGLLPLYVRWRHLVETGDAPCANLAASDYTANTFLMAFIQRPQGLIHATRVMRDMQTPLPTTAGVEQAGPTVQSWSIFLSGFSRHKKMEIAESVLEAMRKAGIEPNEVTWNSLISGYTKMGNEQGILDAVRRARESRIVWDLWARNETTSPLARERPDKKTEIAAVEIENSAADIEADEAALLRRT